jgi:hypothetical protein
VFVIHNTMRNQLKDYESQTQDFEKQLQKHKNEVEHLSETYFIMRLFFYFVILLTHFKISFAEMFNFIFVFL